MSRTSFFSRARIAGLLLVLALVAGVLSIVALAPVAPPASAAERVATQECRQVDPNLVHGVCLRYRTPSGSGLTWIGSYRAPNGRVFFCIDYLYDSRLPQRARTVPTERLRNQLGDRIGDPEVAALNYLVSRWAGHGSTGSDERDAAIALIVREVMSDGVRSGGVAVYPPGLAVDDAVRPPLGGLDGRVVSMARRMWTTASRLRGPYEVDAERLGPRLVRLGRDQQYRVRVRSGAGLPVPGVVVRVQCSGAVSCPSRVRLRRGGGVLGVRPTEVGRFRLRFVVRGPASDGLLWQARGWRGHEGRTARRAGVQRGWIAQENRDWTVVSAETRVRKARPEIVTQTSHQQVTPGAALHDQVTISGLPPGYAGAATAVLHGPFEQQPGASDCSAGTEVGRVQFPVTADGTYRTPSVVAASVGFYTWMVSLPGDVDAVPVTSPCGLVPETTQVVPFTPRVRTKVSRQHALTGSSLVDTVFVAGVGATPILVRWRLHGPIAPDVSGSCRGLVWDDAPIADRGSFEASGDGTYRTRPSVVREPGCFTYSERIPRTPLTESASTEPGVPVETALVTRPVTPSVPEVPTGAAPAVEWTPRPIEGDAFMPSSRAKPRFLHRFYPGVASAASPGGPVSRLELPRIGVSAPVASVGFDRGTMAIPRDTGTVGWLATTAAAGDLIGSSVISGHVSDPQDRPGALWRLRSARPGDVVHWRSGPAVTRYVVKSVRRYPRSKGVPAELFRTDGPHTLHLVTCARKVVRGDRFHYRDNLVVTAVRVAGRS